MQRSGELRTGEGVGRGSWEELGGIALVTDSGSCPPAGASRGRLLDRLLLGW